MIATLRPALRPAANLAFVVVSLLVAWTVLLQVSDVSPLVTRRPAEVLDYLFGTPDAAEHRRAVLAPLRQTLLDAGIGFVAGLAAASAVATATYLSKGVEAATMPAAMVVRTIPLVALAPIITLVFGNGFATVAVMSGIVVFFPALVTISFGLRSLSAQMEDVIRVYGGTTSDVLLRAAYPSALPSVFAAIRVSVPGAITGALIAEFFTTPPSIGKAVNEALAVYQFDLVWALLVVTTLTSVLLYIAAQLVERLTMNALGLAPES
ncbi:ABC transporter permease [Nocardioides cavernaquae]|nr:ABC transporter permease subunit [Nocardioides cavernaquae]